MIDKNTSDGYHTFKELYEHRHALFIALMKEHPDASWWSKKNSDGSEWDGWVVAGMHLTTGDISYHMPDRVIPLLFDIQELEIAPYFDGHTSQDVIDRLNEMNRMK